MATDIRVREEINPTTKIKDIKDLIVAIQWINGEGVPLNEFPEIIERLVFLEIGLDWPIDVIINNLESRENKEIDLYKIRQLIEVEKKLDESAVPTAKIRELLKEYEEYLENGRASDQALKELVEQYSGRISKRQIKEFIKRWEEVHQEAIKILTERKVVEKLGEKEVKEAAEEISNQVVIMEEKIGELLPPNKADEISKEVINAATGVVSRERFEQEKLEKKIKDTIGQLETEKVQFIKEVAGETPKIIGASLEINGATGKIVDELFEEIRLSDQRSGVLSEVRPGVKEMVKIMAKKIIMHGKKVSVEEVSRAMVEQTNTAIDTSVRKAIVKAENYRQENPEVVKMVARQDLRERIESEMIITERPSQTDWVRRLPLIRNYEQIVEGFVADRPEITGITPEASVLLKTLNLSPKEFDTRVKEYQAIRDRIMIPYKIPEVIAVDDTMRMAQDEPMRRLIHAGQRVTRIQKFLERFGFKKVIGTETFFNDSIPLLKQYGFEGGTKLVLNKMMGGGTSGKLLRFFGGMDGPVGWLGTRVTMGGRAIFNGFGGVGSKLFGTVGKSISGKLTGLGGALGKLLKGAIPKLAAKLGTMGATALGGVLAIPSLVTISAAAIGTVVIAVIVGLFAYSILQSWQISSVVQPMTGSGNQNVEYIPGAPGLAPETIEGECSLADHVTGIKQNYGTWADKELPNGCTFTKSGCGPTSVAKILTRINQTLSPDYLVYEENSTYASMGCDGSSMNQAKLTLEKHLGAGKVVYDSVTRGCNKKDIGEWIKHGKIVMVLADFYSNSEASKVSGHYTLAVALSGGEIITSDPFYQNGPAFDGKREYGHVYKINECLLIDTGEGCL